MPPGTDLLTARIDLVQLDWARANAKQALSTLVSIAVGKFANFTVLGEDPYAVDPERLNRIPVRGTVFAGRLFAAGA